MSFPIQFTEHQSEGTIVFSSGHQKVGEWQSCHCNFNSTSDCCVGLPPQIQGRPIRDKSSCTTCISANQLPALRRLLGQDPFQVSVARGSVTWMSSGGIKVQHHHSARSLAPNIRGVGTDSQVVRSAGFDFVHTHGSDRHSVTPAKRKSLSLAQ